MRLIDADALPVHRVKILHAYGVFDGDVIFPEHVANAITIDAEPVRHGRWIKSNKHIWRKTEGGEVDYFAFDFEYHNGPECEICGFHFCEHCYPEKFDEESCKDQYFCSVCGRMEMKEEPYCHCGAKMDLK